MYSLSRLPTTRSCNLLSPSPPKLLPNLGCVDLGAHIDYYRVFEFFNSASMQHLTHMHLDGERDSHMLSHIPVSGMQRE